MAYRKRKSDLAASEHQALREGNHPLIPILDDLRSSIQVIDPYHSDFPLLYVNKGFTRLTGYAAKEVVGESATLLHGEDTDSSVIEEIHNHIHHQESVTTQILHYHKDGTPFWNELHIGPVKANEGEVLYYIGFQHDITEKKHTEQKLKEREQRYQSLFEHHPELICSFDLNGLIQNVNPAVETITGYRVDEVLQRTYTDFIINQHRDRADKLFLKVAKGKQQQKEVFTIQHKDGDTVDLEMTGVPIIVDRDIVGIYGIGKDVTTDYHTQEMLKRAEKLNVVGELAAGIAHEIRNPLTSLKGFIQLLRPDLEQRKAYTDVMLSELERIEQIVNELLILARPQATAFAQNNLSELLDHVRILMNSKAIMSNIDIVLDYQCSLEKIYCEENQLKQIFINLLKNAIEAMPSGGTITMEAVQEDDEHIRLRIIDEGEGIPEDSLPKLGEPFYTTKEQGTGLGLMISQKMIKEHGGTMTFNSRPHQGTTVEIVLPVSPEDPKTIDNTYSING